MFKILRKDEKGKIPLQTILGVATVGLLGIITIGFLLFAVGPQSVIEPGNAQFQGNSGPTGNPGLTFNCRAQENDGSKNECNITLFNADTGKEVSAQTATTSGSVTFSNLPGDLDVIARVSGAGAATAIYPTSVEVTTPIAGTDTYTVGYFSQNNNAIPVTVFDPITDVVHTSDFAMNQNDSKKFRASIAMPGSTANDFNVFGSGDVPEHITGQSANFRGVIDYDSNLIMDFELSMNNAAGQLVKIAEDEKRFKNALAQPDTNRTDKWYFTLPRNQFNPNETINLFVTVIADETNAPVNAGDQNAGIRVTIRDVVENERVANGTFEYVPTNQSSGANLANANDIQFFVNIG